MNRERRKTTTQQQQQQQQQGVNWALIAGGAVATVLSVAFGRSRKKKNKPNAAAPTSSGESDALSLRRESSSASSSSSKSESSEADEAFSVFNRSAVHKLRRQLRSRDQMIMQMQSQLTDKERAIFSNKSLISKLEKQLEDANQSIVEVERVIHELGDPPSAAAAAPGAEEAVDDYEAEEEEEELSLVLHAKEGEYGLVFEKAKHLEAELVGIRAMAREMSSLLEMSERERLRLHHLVSQLQHKLAFQAKELSTLRATTHFLKLSLGSTRRSGGEIESLRLSQEEGGGLIQLNSSMSAFSNAQERYAGSEKVMEVADIDSSVKEDNSTSSSSASSFPDDAGADSSDDQMVDDFPGFRTEESPGVVRIGSPTIVGSRSVEGNLGLAAARRYLFDAGDEEALEVVEEAEEEELLLHKGSSPPSSVSDEKMLDDTLDDLVRASIGDV